MTRIGARIFALAFIAMCVSSAAFWFSGGYGGGVPATPRIDADQAFLLAHAGAVKIIDVRSPQEQQASGIPEGAAAISIAHAGGNSGFLADVRMAVSGDQSQPVALICSRGGRSNKAAELLRANGFLNVRDIQEGMLGAGGKPGWLNRQLPVTPYAAAPANPPHG